MKPPKADSLVRAAVLQDCKALTASSLRDKYKLTYASWRNMKQRSKTHGAVIAPQFATFAGFLACVGPRPSKKYTLDRLDNSNKEYGPGLVAWRTVEAQNSNKGDTVLLADSDGTTLPLMVWAKRLHVSPNTLYSRRKMGWSDVEILHGKAKPPLDDIPTLLARTPWPPEHRLHWETMYQKHFIEAARPFHDRRDYLVHVLRGQIPQIRTRLEELRNLVPPEFEDANTDEAYKQVRDALDTWQGRHDRALAVVQRVEDELRMERKRRQFAGRRSSLGTSAERLLFDIVSGRRQR